MNNEVRPMKKDKPGNCEYGVCRRGHRPAAPAQYELRAYGCVLSMPVASLVCCLTCLNAAKRRVQNYHNADDSPLGTVARGLGYSRLEYRELGTDTWYHYGLVQGDQHQDLEERPLTARDVVWAMVDCLKKKDPPVAPA